MVLPCQGVTNLEGVLLVSSFISQFYVKFNSTDFSNEFRPTLKVHDILEINGFLGSYDGDFLQLVCIDIYD